MYTAIGVKDIDKKNEEINIDVIKLKKFPDIFFLLICFIRQEVV